MKFNDRKVVVELAQEKPSGADSGESSGKKKAKWKDREPRKRDYGKHSDRGGKHGRDKDKKRSGKKRY